MRKSAFIYVNNKDTYQPVHLHSLISVFIVPCLDRIIHLISISEISGFWLTSVAEQTRLNLNWPKTPKTCVSRHKAQIISNVAKQEILEAKAPFWSKG